MVCTKRQFIILFQIPTGKDHSLMVSDICTYVLQSVNIPSLYMQSLRPNGSINVDDIWAVLERKDEVGDEVMRHT